MSHAVGKLTDEVSHVKDQNEHMKAKIQQIYEGQDKAILSAARGARDDFTVESETPSGIHTRQVSSTVPACIIRSYWHSKSALSSDMGVTMKYLKNVCDSIFPKMEPQHKTSLGTML